MNQYNNIPADRGSENTQNPPDPRRPAQPSRRQVVIWLVLSFMFLVPGAMLAPLASISMSRARAAVVNSTFQMDNEEGALLYQAMRIREGSTIYPDISQSAPWFAGTYTPLYMATVAALDDFSSVSFRTGRLISWACALGVAMLAVALITGVTRNLVAGLLSGVLFLATYEVYRWIAYFRVDFLALSLSLAGFTTIVLASGKRWSIPLGTLLMVAALYTKQTMLAAPVALLLSSLVCNRNNALKILIGLLVWGIPPLILLSNLTSGQFLQHVFYYNANTFSVSDLKVWTSHTWNLHGWLILGSAAGLVWMFISPLRRRTPPGETEGVPAQRLLFGFWQAIPVYAVLCQWNIMGAAKAGSAENYILEPVLGMALLIGCAAGGITRSLQLKGVPSRRLDHAAPLIGAAVLLVCLFSHTRFLTNPTMTNRIFSPRVNVSATDLAGARQVLDIVNEANNPFTELAIFSLQSGKPPVLQPFIMSELARQSRWDASPFIAALENHQYDVLITQRELLPDHPPIEYTARMTEAIVRHYRLDQVISTPLWSYFVYRPKSE